MSKSIGQRVRPSYGRVPVSQAQKMLEDMMLEDEDAASVPGNVETDPGKADPLSGISTIDVANKENRADYAHQLLGTHGNDLMARNTIYGPSRILTASNQAYRVKLPMKTIAKPEDTYNGQTATTEATKPTVLRTEEPPPRTEEPPKPHNSSQSVEGAPRNLSLNPRLVDRSRLDSAAKTATSLGRFTEEPKPLQTPYSQKPVRYSRVPVSQQKPDFDDDDDDDIGSENSVQDVSHSVDDFNREPKPLQIPFSQKPVRYSRVPVSQQKPDFDYDDVDFGSKESIQDVSHFVEEFNSFSGFAEPPLAGSLRSRGDESAAAKSHSTSIDVSELMALLDFTGRKATTKKLDSITTDHIDQKLDRFVELTTAGDAHHKSVRFTDIESDPHRSQLHSESSGAKEHQSLSFRLDRAASASNLNPKPESAFDVNQRHFSGASNAAEPYQRPAQISELSNTGEIYRRSVRNYPDSANFVALQQRSVKTQEVSSNGGVSFQRSSANQELSNKIESSQLSTLVRDSRTVGSVSQKLAISADSVTNTPLTPFSHLTTLVINGNDYVLFRLIGKGGSSKVYKGITPDCKDCAVKCVSFATADESMIASYRNEIRLLQQLQNNEEVVKLYDYMFDEAANMLYVVMECGEMDLQTFFRFKESPQTRILRMFVRPYWIQMLSAVDVLHKQGIVHSDLKPANFIVVCGRIKLIDFGIAKTVLPDCTSILCDEIVGTFNYMSPESVTDLNGGRDLTGDLKPNIKISTKSDVWSLGCILYYLVYSRTPFEHIRNQIMKLQAIMNPSYKIEFPATNIPHVIEVLKKCLERNPKNRPTIKELLEHPYVTID